ncbi:calcium-binding protein [Paraferrimonas haliotis]|uniref:calcium-binding protein n=1 Tax=Paraferrimonas haliotis TaxID=2013866 RepID=UPI000BA97096|nr:calcium-binding protein [Paraferrimonas haliotis]
MAEETIVGTSDADVVATTDADTHVKGKQGDDVIDGGSGNDVLEGNRGDDVIDGGSGDDLLFGGVGNDTLTGGEGDDTFAMRITHGGINTITDFEVGGDALQFLLDRKHFLLANDLTKNDNQEARVDDKLDSKVDRLDDRFLGESLGLDDDASGLEKADAFVVAAVENKLDISVDGDDLVLTFFADVGNGNKGTTINLTGLATDEHIARILNSGDDEATKKAAIVEMLTKGYLHGTSDDDVINGSEDDDVFISSDGHDHFHGGDGMDTAMFTGSVLEYNFQSYKGLRVIDTVDGRDGISELHDVEKVTFNDGTFVLKKGHNAYDKLVADDGVDTLLVGLHGSDDIYGGTGNDVLFGDNGVNFHYKGGDDYLDGGAGNDILIGGAGNDTLKGGEGEDTAVFSGSVFNYAFQTYQGIRVTDQIGKDGVDELFDIEYVTFDEGTYLLKRGHNAGDVMTAEDGVDTMLVGMHGDDTLTGGTGNDVLIGDNGANFTYNPGNDTLDGGAGNDIMIAGAGDDMIYADQKAPAHLAVNAESDIIDGGDGVDELTYNDTYLNADSLNVSVVDGNTFEVNTMDGDTVTSTDVVANVEILNGTRGDDVIDFSGLGHGMTYNDKWTGAGNDMVTGTDFNDTINLMHGDDTVYASGGQDYYNGGGGDDTLVFDAGTEIVVEVHGPAYKGEYKVSVVGSDDYTIVKDVEFIQVGDDTESLEELLGDAA